MAPENQTQQNIAATLSEVSERATLLVREEIELAKAEITEKVTKLARGAAIALAAGVFVITALLFALHGFAWLVWFEVFPGNATYFWGFFVVALILLLLGALAGLLAYRALRAGAPPTPDMAIDEAKRIRETVASPENAPGPLATEPKAGG